MSSRKGRRLNLSLILDAHKTSGFQEVRSAIHEIFIEVLKLRRSKKTRIYQPGQIQAHLQAIVLDLFLAYFDRPYVYRSIHMRAEKYTATHSRYEPVHLTYRHTISVKDDLIELGYIKLFRGFHDDESGDGRITRIRAKKKLIDFIKSHAVEIRMVGSLNTETIYLKDENKDLIEYEDDENTNRMRANLDLINQHIAKRRIWLALTDSEYFEFQKELSNDDQREQTSFHSSRLFRVFNNSSFEQGGRFYGGWWQNIPKEYRKYINVDYKETTEIDYSGLHIRILYGKEGLECPDDPYDLKNFPRDQQKESILTILNSDSRKRAIQSLAHEGVKNPKELCDALIERHKPISGYFFTGIGVHLQFMDSQIAEKVMLKTIDLGGIALPVHDSFIVRSGREHELKVSMQEAFHEVIQGIPAAMKRKESIYEQQQREQKKPDDEISFVESTEEDWKEIFERRRIRHLEY